MKSLLMATALLCLTPTLHADDVFKIQIGKDYQKYSHSDLQRRVYDLERAVWQLQQKVFQLEANNAQTADTWVCTINAMGNSYPGTGASKAVATMNAIQSCKAARGGDGFFCKDPTCEH